MQHLDLQVLITFVKLGFFTSHSVCERTYSKHTRIEVLFLNIIILVIESTVPSSIAGSNSQNNNRKSLTKHLI